MTGMRKDNFENVIFAMKSGRDIDRIDILGVNQSFLTINESVTPMQDTVGLFMRNFVSPKRRSILERIAKAQDLTQSLPYHNSCQATKEMVSYLLLSCLEMDDVYAHHNKNLRDELDIGIFTMAARYYKASLYQREWRATGMMPEMHYADMAQADGLFDGLDSNIQTKIWDCICQSGIGNRENITQAEPAYLRNISDSVIIPFIGISYELNLDDRTRIRTQNDMRFGEQVTYDSIIQKRMQPLGSASGTSYDIFIQRMMQSGNSSFRVRSASPKIR